MAVHSSHNFSVCSFNMHGFNQGEPLVNQFCLATSCDLILLQEHWLSSSNLFRIDNSIGPNYFCFASSSIDNDCNTGILRGRPYGGLAVVVNSKYRALCSCVYSSDRILAVLLANTLIIDVYFPCTSTIDYKDITLDIIGKLENIFLNNRFDTIIFGGDFNCNLDVSSWSSDLISEFMLYNNLTNCECKCSDSSMVTYHHDTLHLYS